MHFLVERTVDGNAADKEEAAKGEAKRQELAKIETKPVVPAIISEPERPSTLFLTRNTHAEEWAKAKEKMRVDSNQREIDNAESAARTRSEEDFRNKRLAERKSALTTTSVGNLRLRGTANAGHHRSQRSTGLVGVSGDAQSIYVRDSRAFS